MKQSTISIVDLEKFKDTNLLSISVKRWGNRMQVRNMAALSAYLEELKADGSNGSIEQPAVTLDKQDRVKSSKVLIKSPTYKALCRELSDIKAWCVARSMPSYFRPGMFVVKQDQTETMNDAINSKLDALKGDGGALSKFIAAYPTDIELARTLPVTKGGLGPLFNEADYPNADQMPAMFDLDWNWLTVGVAVNLSEKLKEVEGEKFKKRLLDAAEDIENALRSEFLELIEHAQERLTVAPGDAPKVFRESMIGNIVQFLETFESKDIFNDGRLSEIVKKARGVILDEKGTVKITSDKLRKFANIREAAKGEFDKLKTELAAMIEEKSTRKFDLAED